MQGTRTALTGKNVSGVIDTRLLLMHQVMLSDNVRLEAYDRALAQVVKPSDVVIDVGSGLLALSLLALRRGARHVYALEGDPQTAAIAQQIAEENHLQDQLTIVLGDARTVSLPEKADVLVSEMMGNLGPEEEMAEILLPVARQNLRLGGRAIPQRLATQIQALQFDNEGWGVWNEDFAGYSLCAVQKYAPPVPQLHFFCRTPRSLSSPATLASCELGQDACEVKRDHVLEITTHGCLHAVVGYFTAMLVPGVTISNFPSYPGCNWASWIWPVRHTEVFPGDVVLVAIQRPAQARAVTNWRLECQILRRNGGN